MLHHQTSVTINYAFQCHDLPSLYLFWVSGKDSHTCFLAAVTHIQRPAPEAATLEPHKAGWRSLSFRMCPILLPQCCQQSRVPIGWMVSSQPLHK